VKRRKFDPVLWVLRLIYRIGGDPKPDLDRGIEVWKPFVMFPLFALSLFLGCRAAATGYAFYAVMATMFGWQSGWGMSCMRKRDWLIRAANRGHSRLMYDLTPEGAKFLREKLAEYDAGRST